MGRAKSEAMRLLQQSLQEDGPMNNFDDLAHLVGRAWTRGYATGCREAASHMGGGAGDVSDLIVAVSDIQPTM